MRYKKLFKKTWKFRQPTWGPGFVMNIPRKYKPLAKLASQKSGFEVEFISPAKDRKGNLLDSYIGIYNKQRSNDRNGFKKFVDYYKQLKDDNLLNNKSDCVCEIDTLMGFGCQCGGK